ncbi:hypothetical protein H4R34_002727 [Dimargaris verticillata]|uniref:Band 7 domain-containing protein n=1 Tax=Dimargaris verticillata TaxID=2761393 RepID=A0A9W8B7L4_9FUNG|nr:hypothetical protein H4R34_002727 [Dimargaris verticillata]
MSISIIGTSQAAEPHPLHRNESTVSGLPVHRSQTRLMRYSPPQFSTELDVHSDSVYESVVHFFGKFFGGAGLFYKAVDPGLIRVNPLSESITTIDVRLQIQPIVGIPIVTKDNVNIIIEAVLYWHITDPYLASFGVVDVKNALIERAQTTLRAVLGTRELQDIIENRETIADDIRDIIDVPAKAWGVNVESVLIKDLTFSPELQESLSSAATQKRIGEAKVIAAKAEVDAARLMRQAAEILNTPSAMQIRYLETMQRMAKGPNNKLMFVPMSNPPLPNDTLSDLLGGKPDTNGPRSDGGTALNPLATASACPSPRAAGTATTSQPPSEPVTFQTGAPSALNSQSSSRQSRLTFAPNIPPIVGSTALLDQIERM